MLERTQIVPITPEQFNQAIEFTVKQHDRCDTLYAQIRFGAFINLDRDGRCPQQRKHASEELVKIIRGRVYQDNSWKMAEAIHQLEISYPWTPDWFDQLKNIRKLARCMEPQKVEDRG